jgi:hypothetical protein
MPLKLVLETNKLEDKLQKFSKKKVRRALAASQDMPKYGGRDDEKYDRNNRKKEARQKSIALLNRPLSLHSLTKWTSVMDGLPRPHSNVKFQGRAE